MCLQSKCVSGTNAQSIRLRSHQKLCLAFHKGFFSRRLVLEPCSNDSKQRWTFNKGEYQNEMQIQPDVDSSLCLHGGFMAKGETVKIARCNGKASQTWRRDIGAGSLFILNPKSDNMCIDAGVGIEAGKAM